ncbi:MAG TPA: SpoIIE family protein phosphatase [Candidatus Sulfotelmatobacter sp.]|nr:SpoIIE family protein phosphatase [Candidatus Sulfotelmatobacter sp.]
MSRYEMSRTSARPLAVTALLLIVVVPILIGGGALVRQLVDRGFGAELRVHQAQLDLGSVLNAQLDEETGVRGYAATGNRLFLAPYQHGRDDFAGSMAAVERDAAALQLDDRTAIADMRATNQRWQRLVAEPLLRNARDGDVIQLHGKALIDRFRLDADRVDTMIAARQALQDASTRAAIDRINLLVLVAVVAVSLAALGFGIVQTRTVQRLEAEERLAGELRVAYETERRVAETLQDAFLQRPLPTTASVSFSATYVPASEEAKVGGDWYDGVELSRGRVMFVIGDVAGHGLEAAVAMNRTRQALVQAAVLDADPASLLSRVNAELMRDRSRMVTAVCGYADSQNYVFTYATAGHPPPVLVEPGRAPRLLEFGGLPLAVMDSAVYRSHSVQTLPGAMLVLYTDGAVEHSRDVFEGEQRLLEAVASVCGGDPVEHVAAAIHARIFDGRAVGDDVAILTVSFAAPGDMRTGDRDASRIVAEGTRGGSASIGGTIVSLYDRVRRRRPPGVSEPRRIAS